MLYPQESIWRTASGAGPVWPKTPERPSELSGVRGHPAFWRNEDMISNIYEHMPEILDRLQRIA